MTSFCQFDVGFLPRHALAPVPAVTFDLAATINDLNVIHANLEQHLDRLTNFLFRCVRSHLENKIRPALFLPPDFVFLSSSELKGLPL